MPYQSNTSTCSPRKRARSKSNHDSARQRVPLDIHPSITLNRLFSISLPDLVYHSVGFPPPTPLYHSMSNTLTLSLPPSQHPHLSIAPQKSLSKELQRIFQLPAPEELLAEYSSWLSRAALLKGHLYLTSGHLCFHAFLNSTRPFGSDPLQPSNKSGVLTRCHSRKLNKIVKSWFILDRSVLSWYPSSHQSYFPTGQIDLHFCTHILSASPDSKHPTQFELYLSDGKVLTFRSDTQQSKDEWVQVLNQSLLGCQHDNQNVKIVIPLGTIDRVEKCDSIQFAQTIRIAIKQNAPLRPFVQDETHAPLAPNPLDDGSLNDYFFGFLQDSQAPYDSINVALELAHATSRSLNNLHTVHLAPKSHHFSLPAIDHSPPLPQPIHDYSVRDSTRFIIPTAALIPSATRNPFGESPLSSPAPQSGSSSPANFLHSSPDECTSNSKLSTRINRFARSSNKFVGSPIRPASHLVKVHHYSPGSSTANSSRSPPRSIQSSNPDPTSTSASPPMNSHKPDEMIRSNRPLTRAQSSSGVESHVYPPKGQHRLQYSTYRTNITKDRLHSSPQASPPNSPIAPIPDPASTDSNKPWAMLPGWLKSVPMALSKPSKDATPQDQSDDEEPHGAQLTARDEIKFCTEFNFLNSGLSSDLTHDPMRLLLKAKCNLIRGGSPMFGQIYLASSIGSEIRNQKTARKALVCFKGYKRISSALNKMILPVEDLTIVESKGNKLHLITNQQHHPSPHKPQELWFEFRSEDQLKVVHEQLNNMIETTKQSAYQCHHVKEQSSADGEEVREEQEDEGVDDTQVTSHPIMFQSSSSSFLTFKPQSKLHATCLTIGSRGDVQPYIALCQKLQLDGHKCRIASHGEYRQWVEGYGIEYYEIGGDPAELMKICVDNGMFTLGFLKEAFSKFRGWLDDLLLSSYEACKGTDLLIESPSTMAGVHIAEALQIPYFRAFTMPWTRTKEYPHAFAVPDRKMGGSYNYMTYTVFDQVFWKAMSGQVNKWRKEQLGLKSTTYEKLQVHKIPFLYNFSPTIVPSPLDWFEWIHVTGYWFIDEDDPNKLSNKKQSPNLNTNSIKPSETRSIQPLPPSSPPVAARSSKSSWKAPSELLQFLDRAQALNKKVVYIGFGSIVVPDPEATTQVIIESIKTAGVYAILSKGWSERLSNSSNKKAHQEAQVQANGNPLEDSEKKEDLSMVYHVDSIPHDWLFPRIHAVCHHGGAGTTGASLRAGLPTIIKPFFGDQFFWAERVETLGIGASVRKLTVKNLTQALINATTDDIQIKKARSVGEQIRSECGAAKAVECIYRDLEYAKSLIKRIHQSDEVNNSKSSNLNPEMISRPMRHLSYSSYAKSSANHQKSGQNNLPEGPTNKRPTSAVLVNDSSTIQMPSSIASNSQLDDCPNNTERMDLTGSSLLILPPSNTTTATATTTTIAPVSNPSTTSSASSNHQESIINYDSNFKYYTGSSSANCQACSSPDYFFDCDLENSRNQLVDPHNSKDPGDETNAHSNNESEQEEVGVERGKPNSITTSSVTAKKPMPRKTGNCTSDEDSSWDILSQGSKSGPSSNELSNSFDRF